MRINCVPLFAMTLAIQAQEPPRAVPPLSPVPAPQAVRFAASPGFPGATVAPTQQESLTNYQITVEFKDAKASTNTLSLVTTDGKFTLQGITLEKVQIDDNLLPVTLSLDGSLQTLPQGKFRLTLFLGRTRPHVTGTVTLPGGKTSPQVQQTQQGLNTTVVLTPDKPLTIHADKTEQITLTLRPLSD